MKKGQRILCLLLFVLSLSAPSGICQITGRVIGVQDGDTIEILDTTTTPPTPVRIRLAEIDSPEKKQPFGMAAKQYVSSLVYGKIVTAIGKKKDRNGRLIADVYTADGLHLNSEIVRNGYGWHYVQYSKPDSPLAGLQREAQAAKRGLWQDTAPVPPWEYRKSR